MLLTLHVVIPDLVDERANVANLHSNICAILQHHSRLPEEAYARRRASQKDSACF